MTWARCQFKKEPRPVRHARAPLCVSRCVDCKRELRATHLVALFGQRCRSCWQAFMDGMGVEVAGHSSEW